MEINQSKGKLNRGSLNKYCEIIRVDESLSTESSLREGSSLEVKKLHSSLFKTRRPFPETPPDKQKLLLTENDGRNFRGKDPKQFKLMEKKFPTG